MSDAWEQVRHTTVDTLVTKVKQEGSALMLEGFTTPEGHPFVLVVAVANPGNELALEYAKEFAGKMNAAAKWSKRGDNPKRPRRTR